MYTYELDQVNSANSPIIFMINIWSVRVVRVVWLVRVVQLVQVVSITSLNDMHSENIFYDIYMVFMVYTIKLSRKSDMSRWADRRTDGIVKIELEFWTQNSQFGQHFEADVCLRLCNVWKYNWEDRSRGEVIPCTWFHSFFSRKKSEIRNTFLGSEK